MYVNRHREHNLGDLEAERLGEQICELAGHQAAAMCRWLLLVAAFHERQGWAVDGIISCAHWLSWRCGIALGTARDHVRVARRLAALPVTISRFATGELSYAKVRALVRVATPDNEAGLVDMALQAMASQFEQMVREFKRSERDALGDDARRPKRLYLRSRFDDDGDMIITAKVAPEEGSLVMDLLEALARRESPRATADVSAETREAAADDTAAADNSAVVDNGAAAEDAGAGVSAETPDAGPDHGRDHRHDCERAENDIETTPEEQARAAALISMARMAATALQDLDDDDTSMVSDRPHLLVHLNIDALGRPDGAHLDHGPNLPYATACRLGCEGTMAVLVEDQRGNPLHLGDASHGINRAQRRALLARDKGCRFPGCTNRRYLHAHHIKHWIDGGLTCIPNLVLLCRRHHRAVHEGGFGCTGTNGDVTFTRAHSTAPIPAVPSTTPADPARSIDVQNQQLGLTISPATPGSRDNGARYNRVLTSDVLWTLIHRRAFFDGVHRGAPVEGAPVGDAPVGGVPVEGVPVEGVAA